MKRLFQILLILLVAGCSTMPTFKATPAAPKTKLILILVGGNSETVHNGGLWELYGGWPNLATSPLLNSIRGRTGLTSEEIATYYFSWTGDDESRRSSVLPGHWNWILGGSKYIEDSLADVLLNKAPGVSIAIVGWSNGGATAYELACRLSKKEKVGLLVTLDPVSWTTSACGHYNDGAAATPSPWISVFTSSGLMSRLRAGNIIALIGRAWDDDKLPSTPTSLRHLTPGNHGDTRRMWNEQVLEDEIFATWAKSFTR